MSRRLFVAVDDAMRQRHLDSKYKNNFGNEGRVSYPYVRVSVQGDGWLEVVVCRNKNEYHGSSTPARMYISPGAGAKLRDALIAAMPKARREEAARRKRRQRHNARHPIDVPECVLCRYRKPRKVKMNASEVALES